MQKSGSRKSNCRPLIERISDRLPGFNRRSLTLDDLHGECERRGIQAVELPFRKIHGCSLYLNGAPYLYINTLLPMPERIIAGWHEFTHLTDQVEDTKVFLSTGNLWLRSKAERQAQIVGCIALMPDEAVWGMTAPEIMEAYSVPLKVAQFRLNLFFE